VQDARFYHPTFRLNRREEWLPTICRFGDGLVQMRLGGSGRTQINQMVSRQNGRQRFIATILLLGSSLRVSNYRRRASGFLTSAALRGASIFKMMDVSRHRSVETLRGYVRDAELFRDHAGAGLP